MKELKYNETGEIWISGASVMLGYFNKPEETAQMIITDSNGTRWIRTGDLGYTIPCECDKNVHKHVEGTMSMAHRGKDTGCCQFFICHSPQPHLDGVHTVFGQVTDNMGAVRNMHNGDVMTSITIQD